MWGGRERCKIKTHRQPVPLQISRAVSTSTSFQLLVSAAQNLSVNSAEMPFWLKAKTDPPATPPVNASAHNPPSACFQPAPLLAVAHTHHHILSAIIWTPKCHHMHRDRTWICHRASQLEVIKALQINQYPIYMRKHVQCHKVMRL